jgi:hypothetical protein
MKKITLILILGVILTTKSFPQLNPIMNLSWQQWYIMPYNYFRLTWDPPEMSSSDLLGDTLMGYNVYRDQVLYRFQTETLLNHEEGGGNCGEDFIWYNWGMPFFIHVTAVYNSSHQESIYNDSAYCPGLAIGISSINLQTPYLYPNPTTGRVKLNSPNIKDVRIYDQKGSLILHILENSEFDLSSFPSGAYFAKFIINRQEFVEKILLY